MKRRKKAGKFDYSLSLITINRPTSSPMLPVVVQTCDLAFSPPGPWSVPDFPCKKNVATHCPSDSSNFGKPCSYLLLCNLSSISCLSLMVKKSPTEISSRIWLIVHMCLVIFLIWKGKKVWQEMQKRFKKNIHICTNFSKISQTWLGVQFLVVSWGSSSPDVICPVSHTSVRVSTDAFEYTHPPVSTPSPLVQRVTLSAGDFFGTGKTLSMTI